MTLLIISILCIILFIQLCMRDASSITYEKRRITKQEEQNIKNKIAYKKRKINKLKNNYFFK